MKRASFTRTKAIRLNYISSHILTAGFTNRVRIAFDTRVAMLHLTHTFNNQQLKGLHQRKTGSEEETQRTS